MEKKKINKVILFIPSLSGGGAEKIVSELSLNFPKNIEVIIVLFWNKISYFYNGKLISMNSLPSKNIFIRLFHFCNRVYKFKKILNIEKPNIVISFLNGPNFVNIVTANQSIINVVSFQSRASFTFSVNFLIKLLYNRAGKIIACSEGVKNDLIENFCIKKNKIKVIYPPINVEKIQQLANKQVKHPWFKEDIPIIITFGRLTKTKGHYHLIKAFSEVRKHFPCRMVILSEGKLRKSLEKFGKTLLLDEDILFLGWQENPFKFIAKSTIFIYASLLEGLPMVLLEAMACGLPVISTDCLSGPREILTQDTTINYQTKNIEYAKYGILTPVCDDNFPQKNIFLTKKEKMLAEATIKMLTNKSIRKQYKKASLNRAKDFDIKEIIPKWIELIDAYKD